MNLYYYYYYYYYYSCVSKTTCYGSILYGTTTKGPS